MEDSIYQRMLNNLAKFTKTTGIIVEGTIYYVDHLSDRKKLEELRVSWDVHREQYKSSYTQHIVSKV